MSKKNAPKQVLQQNRFHEHYYTESHAGIEDWIITLTDRKDTLK